MNKEERVKLVFETLSKIAGFEIKPDKDFYMVANGLKYTYKIDENLNIFFYKTATGEYKESFYNISTFFNTLSQLEEVKEPLLTDEEKDFLRHFKFEKLEISTDLYIYSKNNLLIATIDLSIVNFSLNGLEKYTKYSREELEL